MMGRTFLNPTTNKQWRIELDGHTIRTCLNGGKLLATIDDPFVVRQVNFAFTKSGLVLHTDYGAMSIYSCAL